MTNRELIEQLSKLPPEAKVTVYESDPDAYVDIGRADINPLGNRIRLISQLAIDDGFA